MTVKRLDPRAKVTGAAQYTCDIRLPGMAYVALVESPVAHARITALRLDQAHGLPGILGILTGSELKPLEDRDPVRRNPGRKGDTVALLALMDVLAVPNVCGSGDVSNTSNYWFRPIRIQVRDATPDVRRIADTLNAKHTGFINQRRPEQYRVKPRDGDRALRRDAHYQPRFVNYPMKIQELTLNLTDADMANVRKLIRRGQGSDPEDAIRSAVMTLYTRLPTPQILPEALDAEGT